VSQSLIIHLSNSMDHPLNLKDVIVTEGEIESQ